MIIDNWRFSNPVTIINSNLELINSYTKGKQVLIITSYGFQSRGVVDKLKKFLYDKNVLIYDSVISNPDIYDLDIVLSKFKSKGIDSIVALGGGSVIDSAKALACSIANPNIKSIDDLFNSQENIINEFKLPLIVIPTTSGTGSEVTPFATIWDRKNNKKLSLFGSFIYPDIAFLDKNITLTLNYENTLFPALDSVSHALESLWNINKTPISEIFAIKSLELIINSLPILLRNLNSIEHRQMLQIASLYSGISISQTKTAIAHSISYPLTSFFSIPHGLACSFTLPRIIEHFLNHNPNTKYFGIMRDIKKLIEAFELDKLVANYASKNSIMELTNQMFKSDRAENFLGDLPDIEAILFKTNK